jgi:sialic acid synthase SpsE
MAQREVGPEHPTFVAAETGINHGGILDRALQV